MPPPFQRLLDEHAETVLRFCVASAGPIDGDDVFQETVVAALRAYPRLRHGEHLRAWLYRVVTTTAIDAHRARRPEVLVGALPTDAAAPPDTGEDGFSDLIASLPEPSRVALRLRFVEDLDHEAIAERLGISPAAARQRVSTAVRTLRKEHAA